MALTKINDRSGYSVDLSNYLTSVSTSDLPAGSVLQVVSQDFGSREFNTTLTTGTKISNDLLITPISTTSKILVQASLTNEIGQDGGTISASSYFFTRIYRGGYSGGVQGIELDNASGHQFPRQGRQHFTGTWFDSPATTSQIPYAIHCSGGSNLGGVRWIFYNIVITAMEIAG